MKYLQKYLKKPKVILVRHGSTDLNNDDKSKDRIRGWQDIPLNKEGIQDAHKAAEKLKKVHIDFICSSDLGRALETAKIVNEDHNAPIMEYNQLRPWGLGIFEGKITNEVLPKMKEYIEDETKKVPNGESFKQFRERYLALIDKIAQLATDKNYTIMVATHYRNVKCVEAWEVAGCPSDYTVDVPTMEKDGVKPGEIYELDIDKWLESRKKSQE